MPAGQGARGRAYPGVEARGTLVATVPETPRPLEAARGPSAHPQRRAFIVVLGLAVLHAWAVWGYTGIFWAEHGSWLHAVSRFAAGETPYRDFTFANPPLALWVLGGIASVTGSGFAAISATTTVLYLLTFVVFLLALRRLAPDLLLPIALPALLFAVAIASSHGVPLPAGSESPSAPVGFLCILGAAWFTLETVERPGVLRSAGAGALVALAMLSKHDFWAASIYLLAAGGFFFARRRAPMRVMVAMPVAFAAVFLAGVGLLVARAGLSPVAYMFVGSGQALEVALRSTPSLERLTVEVAAAAAIALTGVTALWLCLAISDRTAARWAGALLLTFLTAAAVHLGMSVAIGDDLEAGLSPLPTLTEETLWRSLHDGRGLLPSAIALFDSRLQSHLLPFILPPILLAVLLARWKRWHDPLLRGRVALLLGLCITARVRRGFSGADWYNVLLELPAYALYLQLVCGPARHKAFRAVRACLALLIVLALYAYVSLGTGPLTIRGILPRTVTRNGAVRWPAVEARAYRAADTLVSRLDPSGSRPVYAVGASGGWNFFLHRANPLPFTNGLPSVSTALLDSAAERLRATRPAPILIHNRFALLPMLTAGNLFAWEPISDRSRFARRDAPWFDALAATCQVLGHGDSTAAVRVFDCRW